MLPNNSFYPQTPLSHQNDQNKHPDQPVIAQKETIVKDRQFPAVETPKPPVSSLRSIPNAAGSPQQPPKNVDIKRAELDFPSIAYNHTATAVATEVTPTTASVLSNVSFIHSNAPTMASVNPHQAINIKQTVDMASSISEKRPAPVSQPQSFQKQETTEEPPKKKVRKSVPPKELSLKFLPGEDGIHFIEEIPKICHFFWIFQELLKMSPFSCQQLEVALMNPDTSLMLQILSRVVLNATDLNILKKNECTTKYLLDQLLSCRVKIWYLQYDEGSPELEQVYKSIGEENPLETAGFDQLSYTERARIVYKLCEDLMSPEGKFWNYTKKVSPSHLREEPFATDCIGAKYYYFGLPDDCYIYRELPAAASSDITDSSQDSPRFGVVCDSFEGLSELMGKIDKRKAGSKDVRFQLGLLLEQLKPLQSEKTVKDKRSEKKVTQEIGRKYNFRQRTVVSHQEDEEVPKMITILERYKNRVGKLVRRRNAMIDQSDDESEDEEEEEEPEEEVGGSDGEEEEEEEEEDEEDDDEEEDEDGSNSGDDSH